MHSLKKQQSELRYADDEGLRKIREDMENLTLPNDTTYDQISVHNGEHNYTAKIRNREYVTEIVHTSPMKIANARTHLPPLAPSARII